mgnify:FL=1
MIDVGIMIQDVIPLKIFGVMHIIIVKGEISYDDIGVSNYILKIANSAIVCSWINFASIWLHCFHLLSIVFSTSGHHNLFSHKLS